MKWPDKTDASVSPSVSNPESVLGSQHSLETGSEGRKRRLGVATRRHVVYITVTVLSSCAAFAVVMETVLHMMKYGEPAVRRDLFSGFGGTGPIYTQRDVPGSGLMYVPSSTIPEMDQSFQVRKDASTFRIFTFGASTTRGVPWGTKGSFSFRLEQYLRQLYPDRKIEVINCGISGYGSSRVLQVMKEMLGYEPDLFVVYTGQNEFRDALFYPDELTRSPLAWKLMKTVLQSRLGYLLYDKYSVAKDKLFGPRLTSYAAQEIERVVSIPFSESTFQSYEYYRTPELVHDDNAWVHEDIRAGAKRFLGYAPVPQEEVYSIFRRNVIAMMEMSRAAKVPIIFLLKAQNPKANNLLREYRTRARSLKAGTENEWKQVFDRAVVEIRGGNCQDAIRDFEQVAGLYVDSDSTSEDWSLLHLYAGECYEKEGLYAKAREHYSQRLSEQHLELNRILREIAAERGVPLIDVQELLAAHAEHGIVGYENFFVDNAHMTIKGYTLIGMRLAEEICDRGYIQKGELLCNVEALTATSKESNVDDEGFDTAQSHTSLGWSAFQQARFVEAIVHGKRAIEKDTGALQAHLLLGYAYTKIGQIDEARKEWDHLRRLWRRGTT